MKPILKGTKMFKNNQKAKTPNRYRINAIGVMFISTGITSFILAIGGKQPAFFGGVAFLPLGIIFLRKA